MDNEVTDKIYNIDLILYHDLSNSSEEENGLS